MKVNPKYNNICWNQNRKCDGCTKEIECDVWYNPVTGDWKYPLYRIDRSIISHKVSRNPYIRHNSPVKLRAIPGGIYDREIKPLF